MAAQAARLWGELKVQPGAATITLETTGNATALAQFVQRTLGWLPAGARA
ncbi:MAG: hypothetical protein U5L74_12185 [Ideonella sp.]|nr:hypothetical protein [Ideonella sp.]